MEIIESDNEKSLEIQNCEMILKRFLAESYAFGARTYVGVPVACVDLRFT